ncbi:MAG: SulP family inorganic anion transporter [Candidatus Limnocylindrales bacterium]
MGSSPAPDQHPGAQPERSRAALEIAGRLIKRYVPITVWLPAYPRDWLRPDLIAGLTSWGVMVPVALAYAGLAGVPAEVGLVTAFAALAAYAVFGTSRHLKVTTSSTMAIMAAAVVTPIAASDPSRYVALSAALALVVGGLLLVAGLVRLGFLAQFMAKSVVTGFVIGLAVTIIVGQLPKLFGLPSASGDVFAQLAALLQGLAQTNPWTLAVGSSALALILLLRWLVPRLPGALVVLVLGIVASTAFDLAAHGVAVVGEVATGVPLPGLPNVSLTDYALLVAGAGGIVFLALAESLGAGRAFAARHGYELDADQELVALGAANLSAGLFGGFAVDASLSQSAAGEAAGTRSQASAILTAVLMLATAMLLAPLFKNLPSAVLGAVVIAAVLSLIDAPEMRRYLDSRPVDFIIAVAAMVGVILTSPLAGMVIAVTLSLLVILFQASRPYIAVLGRVRGAAHVFGDVERHDAEQLAGLLIVRPNVPLYFLNVTVAKDQILALVESGPTPPRAVILDLSATADLDITTVDALRELAAGLRRRGIGLRLAQVRGSVRDRMLVTGLMADLGEEAVFIALDEAVAAPLPTAEPATLAPGTPPAEASEAEASEPGPP